MPMQNIVGVVLVKELVLAEMDGHKRIKDMRIREVPCLRWGGSGAMLARVAVGEGGCGQGSRNTACLLVGGECLEQAPGTRHPFQGGPPSPQV